MVVYNFKKIQVVPPAADFLDIVLSKTQRKTPTVVHKGYQISRIRSFYMRKVKYAGQSFHDKLSQILDDFPLLNDIHPFYADLINVLYDRDHYKLALGHLNTCRHLIDTLGKDYLRLLKYGDSLYRCKQLKRAALGRMCTLIKSQRTTLAYLEEVRQHLSRLPSIDPNTRTIILCGYPNVGKSSFMNKVTRAEVDVQPYAFTTKSLFVGHTFHNYLTWQVIDTPGILDHPLEDRNTIEMQAITALAHLRAAVLYIIDISEQCGYSIKQQVALFESIKPLFSNKPLVIVLNKIDVIRPDDLDPSDRELLEALAQQDNVAMVPMSNLSEEGVMTVKEKACDALLEQRVEVVLKTSRANDVLSRIHVAQPISRDHRNRTAFFPETVAEIKASNLPLVEKKKDRAERKKDPKIASVRVGQFEGIDPDWDPTKTSIDWRKDYLLKNDDWKFDPIPEIMDGYNIADFVDPDIEHMLELLEQEEEERIRQVESELDDEEDGVELTPEQLADAQAIREKKAKMILASREKRVRNHPKIMRKHTARSEPVASFESHLSDLGIDASKAVERARSRSRSRSVSRSKSRLDSAARAIQEVGQKRKRSESRGLSAGIRDAKQQKIADNIQKSFQKTVSNQARKGESDRHIAPKLPKHLFSGKRKMGTHDRR